MNIEDFKIIDVWIADQNVYWILVEGPSKRYKNNPKFKDDHVYYLGLIGALQVPTQLAMMDRVLNNIVLPREKERKLASFMTIIKKHKETS